MKIRYSVILLFLGVTLLSARAQKLWTLQECIDYTLENNLSLRLQELDVKDKEVLLKSARNQALPNLSGSVNLTESFNFSGSSDNTFSQGNSFNTGFGASAGMPLFNGFAIRNSVSQARVDREAAEYNLESRKNNVLLLLLQSYLDILMKKELVTIAEEQLASTQKEKEAVEIKYEVGEVSKDIYLENLAQEARETATLNEAKNNLAYSRLVMAHILDLENPEEFDVVTLKLPEVMAKVTLYNAAILFNETKLTWPDIKSAEKNLESSEYMVAQAKSGYYPSISAFAGYSANYYNTSNLSFSDQLDAYSRPYLGVNVNIPIFSRLSNRNNVKRAKLNYDAMDLQLALVENQLRETIKEAYVSAVAAQSNYESAQKTLDATKESFRFAEEKYKVGAISPYDYNTSKSQLMQAESEMLRSKYQFIFSSKVLEFYKNNNITF
ncbi:TolC family protein [Saccharicrinis sp. FJH54]|uniref:TolC family protein n=1 Tax=Saccharicrinis sp. FJH54 TaxID=3344665 RepID=UPI0035D3E2B6